MTKVSAIAILLLYVCSTSARTFHALPSYDVSACPPLPPHTPSSINDLRPNDIKVVMSLGDSITAAFGLEGEAGALNEYRGQSWDIGADNNATTLYNYFKQFNPNLQGGSVGSHIVELCYGALCPPYQYHPAQDVLNGAQSGATITDLVTHEFDYLLGQLKSNAKIDMKNDWKVLTILIGANDLCLSCEDKNIDADEFERNMRATLENVRTNIPRTFVNLVEMFNISQVYTLSLTNSKCKFVHRTLPVECDCAFTPGAKGDQQRVFMDTLAQQYNARIRSIVSDYASKNYTEFAVVDQPMGRDTKISTFPIDFLSTLDCFHPSKVAHGMMATALWNSMLTPASKKATAISPVGVAPLCPTEDTKLYVN
eukprot:TRINITY_DN971_c0_g1_i1.p1 TRINITY_DN971_c0_g1~~TRINITY_DN971_c0_g1_i1.p1  ORF type:complete len:368 (-),score=69.39 TRINITY_DN971_c0_g1_i1:122-1225(-)